LGAVAAQRSTKLAFTSPVAGTPVVSVRTLLYYL
jgi:hypothetical protein